MGFRLTIRNVNHEKKLLVDVFQACFRLTIRNVNMVMVLGLFAWKVSFRLTIRNVNKFAQMKCQGFVPSVLD